MTEVAEIETPDEAARPGVLRRLLRNPLGCAALIILAIVVLAGILGPFIAPFNGNQVNLANAFMPVGWHGHLLGTDSAGRDILSRILIGARSTLLAAALAAVVAVVIGVPSGLAAGYFGGWFDGFASWCTNVLLSLPAIIILLAVGASLGTSVWVTMTVFGVLMSPGFFRLTRTSVMSVRNELYVDAARVAGVSVWSIIGRHILFVVRAPIVIQASIVCGIAISIQAGLQFLGIGNPLTPAWGDMLNEGFINIYKHPILSVWPGIAISVSVGAFIVLGNALRDALEDAPKTARSAKRVRHVDPDQAISDDPVRVPSEHLLVVDGLEVGYPQPAGGTKRVVSGVSFQVDRGEVVGIVGESGSGKTQTAFSVLGLLPEEARITGGSIVFDGKVLVGGGGRRLSQRALSGLRGKRIAYIPQEPMSNLDPNFTIGHQLVRPMVKVLGIPRDQARLKALELLEIVGIADPERTFRAYPHQVSGGMAQRVLIAGAVSCNPDLLIADEPTTALDVTVQAEVLDLLRDLQKRLDMGVVLVTHNFGVVADLCDRVVVMQTGRVVESGGVRDILRAPSQPYTRELLGAMLEGKTPMTMLAGQSEAHSTEEMGVRSR